MSEVETTATDLTQAQKLAQSLRALADMLDANPTMAEIDPYCFRYPFEAISLPVDTREQIAAVARIALRAGAKVEKHQSDSYAGINVRFGVVGLHLYVDRSVVCERIVTGTHEVTEEVPDPEALAAVPKVTVTKTVEDVEWRCAPLLANETPAAVSA